MKKNTVPILISILLGFIFSFSTQFIIKTYTYIPAPDNGLCQGTEDINSVGNCNTSHTNIYKSGLPLHFYANTNKIQSTQDCQVNKCAVQDIQSSVKHSSFDLAKYLVDLVIWSLVVFILILAVKKLVIK